MCNRARDNSICLSGPAFSSRKETKLSRKDAECEEARLALMRAITRLNVATKG